LQGTKKGVADEYGVQKSMALDQWVDTSQYTPTPGNFRFSPTFPVDYASPQQIVSQKSILLFRFDDGVEGRTYDEDP
jgi:hypothetical protein